MKATGISAPQMRVHKKTGHARVRIDGREIWLGRYGTQECDARYNLLIARWGDRRTKAAGDAETSNTMLQVSTPTAAPTTIAAALGQYLAEINGGGTAAQLRKNARWWLARSLAGTLSSYAGVRLDDFGPKMFVRWVEEVASSAMPHKRNGEAVTRTTTQTRKIVAEMLRMIEWCVASEIIGADRLIALRSVKRLPLAKSRPPTVRKAVPDAIIQATLAHLPPAYAAIVTLVRYAGARPGEIIDMRPCDIDRETYPGVWVLRPAKHKTQRYGRERALALGPTCRAALEPWLAGVPADAKVFTLDCLKRARGGSTIRLRARRPGLPITDTDLRRAVRLACEAAGVKVWTPYALRHSGLTEFRRVGGMDAAQVQGGHGSSATTERYAAADITRAIETAKVCG
jgi:integrase